MKYKIETFPNGAASLLDLEAGETMHSSIGPWAEAQAVYIRQSRLSERLELPGTTPLVLFDVGMGLAANAVAAWDAFENGSRKRELHLVSFEKDFDGLREALEYPEHFAFLRGREDILRQLLIEKRIQNANGFRWELWEGDFIEHLRSGALQEAPDLIYYDFYSPRSCPELWTRRAFKDLYRFCSGSGKATTLYTYCSATSVRTALLLAGFYVGYGVSTQSKRETTVASLELSGLDRPLGDLWLKHWLRSSKPLPPDCDLAGLGPIHLELQAKISK